MTVNNELVRLGDSVIHNKSDSLWLPEYVMPEHVNSGIPDEGDLFVQSEPCLYPIGAQLRKNSCLYRYSKGVEDIGVASQTFLRFNKCQCPGLAGASQGQGFEGAPYAVVVAGDTHIDIADTAATKNLYFGGVLLVFDNTNGFQTYRVIGNDAAVDTTYTRLYIAAPGFKFAIAVVGGPGLHIALSPYMRIGYGGDYGQWYTAMGYVAMGVTATYHFWLKTAGLAFGTMNQDYAGKIAYQRDIMVAQDGSLEGITSEASIHQRAGRLLYGTSALYGDGLYELELDKPE